MDDTPGAAASPLAPAGAAPRRGWRLSAALFALTAVTTLLSGVLWEADARGLEVGPLGSLLADPSLLLLGVPYAASVLGVLWTHEMGHYLACRRHGIDATPPFFLPSPPKLVFGTFGAFIRIRAPITDRRALFDIGVAGPLAGFAAAIPVLVWGSMTARWIPEGPDLGGLRLGGCLAMSWVTGWLAGPPPEPEGYILALGSVGVAGWFGLFATGLNLLPVGQLDGGHIAYAVGPRFHAFTSRLSLAAFVVLGLLVNESWLFWATVMVLLGPRHPRLIDEERPLTPVRLAVAALAFAVLAVTFIPDMGALTAPPPEPPPGASLLR
jgi:membrane-associated protease RseP (regulator of RpoE activity)